MSKTVVSAFGIRLILIGGVETYDRELSRQLGSLGWTSILVFINDPTADVRSFLDLPNVRIEGWEQPHKPNLKAARQLMQILRRHQPSILHLSFVGFINPYPWLEKIPGIHCVSSLAKDRTASQRSKPWKHIATRMINYAITKVFCIS